MRSSTTLLIALGLGASASPIQVARTEAEDKSNLDITDALGPLGELVDKINDALPADVKVSLPIISENTNEKRDAEAGGLEVDLGGVEVKRDAEAGLDVDSGDSQL